MSRIFPAIAAVVAMLVFLIPSTALAAPGGLDPSFGSAGKVVTSFGGLAGGAAAVAVQPDGKIVVVGGTGNSDESQAFAIARYNSNGSLDATFSADGVQTTNVGGGFGANGVAIQPDGKIVVAGPAGVDGKIARYTTAGELDTTFGTDGIATVSFRVLDVLVQPDGKIVAGGGTGDWPNGLFAIARLTSTGDLDPTFASDGIQTVSFADTWNWAGTLALTSDGKIVAGGGAGVGDSAWALVRLNTNGSLDTTFSGDGKASTDFGGTFDSVSEIVIQPGGKIVAAGSGMSFPMASLIVRYNQDGSLDQSFGQGGVRAITGDRSPSDAIALQADGKIVTAGASYNQTAFPLSGFAIARHNPNGTPDNGFLGSGLGTIPFVGYRANDIAIQDDGRIVVVGGEKSPFPGEGSDTEFGLVRLLGGDGAPAPTPPGPPTQPKNPAPKPKPSAPKTPRITDLKLRSKQITTKQRAVVSFRLNRATKVTIRVVKPKAGVRKGKRCVKRRKGTAGKRCDLQIKTLTRSLKAGVHQVRLPRLGAGTYGLVLQGSAGGKNAATRRTRLMVRGNTNGGER